MKDKIQEKIDAQLSKGNTVGKTPEQNIPDKPITIDAVLARDRRQTDIVEINIANQNAIVVEASDAPQLTAEVLAEKGKPTMEVDLLFEDQTLPIEVRNGIPFYVEIERFRLLREFEGNQQTKKDEYDRNLAVLRFLVSELVVNPKLTYRGEGDGTPIEDQSDLLLEAFYKSIVDVTSPTTVLGTYKELSDTLASLKEKLSTLESDLANKEKDLEKTTGEDRKKLNADIQTLAREIGNPRAAMNLTELAISHIYQIEVMRGTPLHAALMSDSFEFYPTGEGKPISNMSDAELDEHIKRIDAQRKAFVSSMILSPVLSWNGEGNPSAYPVESIGESMMQTLYNAHKAVNVKSGGLGLLQRFRKMDTI